MYVCMYVCMLEIEGREGKRRREIPIGCMHPQTGTEPKTQACALSDLSLFGTNDTQPTEPHRSGPSLFIMICHEVLQMNKKEEISKIK